MIHELVIANPSKRGRDKHGRFLKGHAHSPRKRRTHTRSMRTNPSPRKRAASRRAVATHHRRRRRSQFRRNPQGPVSMFKSLIAPAAWGTGGAIGTDIIAGYLPIAATYKTGAMGWGLKTGIAVLLGWIASFGVRPAHAAFLASGGIIKSTADFTETLIHEHMPTIPLGEYQPAFPAAYEAPALSAGMVGGLGAYEGAPNLVPHEMVMV